MADPNLLTLSNVKGRLLDEEDKLSTLEASRSKENSISSAAFSAKLAKGWKPCISTNSSAARQSQSHFPFPCSFCHKVGHKKAECRKWLKLQQKKEAKTIGQVNVASSSVEENSHNDSEFCF